MFLESITLVRGRSVRQGSQPECDLIVQMPKEKEACERIKVAYRAPAAQLAALFGSKNVQFWRYPKLVKNGKNGKNGRNFGGFFRGKKG